ncbi:hypothetical protein AGMMS50239_03590 [Bacteroidia bacterium]|nr:hypothetical protein AGMMS50239_03590 [Bacteroidia bacterium]
MKGIRITFLLLFIAVAAGFSQNVRLDVNRKPLNRVLSTLDLEISFDDKALSTYSVTVSKSFKNSENALYWLLRDKPFAIEKIGNVFVIVPVNNSSQQTTINERFVFNGAVIDSLSRQTLEYATISLLSTDMVTITTGITNNKGRFRIETKTIPHLIKISCFGYKTLIDEIPNLNEEWGEFSLSITEILLSEIIVTANTQTKPNSVKYDVTPQMCNGSANALELLGKIPELHYDKLSDKIIVNQQNNILLLIDGVQYSQHFLKHLSPNRIHAVEVVRALSGRFVSDDYDAIIQLSLKKDYTGFDINFSNRTSLNLSETNNYLTENSPDLGIIYTTNKFNFFGTYSYSHEKWKMYSTKELTYNSSEFVSFPEKNPNDLSAYESNILTGGINYQVTPRQFIGAHIDYSYGNANTHQKYTMKSADKTQNNSRIFENTTEIGTKYNMITSALSYKGQLNNRMHLYGNFSYNYYYNDIVNNYNQNDFKNYKSENLYNEYKNHTVFNIENQYAISSFLSLESGYSNVWRMYGSESSLGRGFLDYTEFRNKAFLYLSFFPSDRIWMKSGLAIEHIKTRGKYSHNNYLRMLPYLQVCYNFNKKINVQVNYSTNQSYPSIYQLSPMSLVIDTFLTQVGNPALKSALRHQVFAEFTLRNKIKIIPQFVFVNDGISEVYERREFKLFRIFGNIQFREYSVQATYDQALNDRFRLKNAVLFYYDEAHHNEVFNSLNGWILQSEINYYNQPAYFGVQVGYYRNMRKNILWQGYQMQNRDYWSVTVQKELWHNRISVMLSYIPPVSLGIRHERTKAMETPLFHEKTIIDMASQKQMLLLNVNFHLEHGSASLLRKMQKSTKNVRNR